MKYEKCLYFGFIVKFLWKSGLFFIVVVLWLVWFLFLYMSIFDNLGECCGFFFCFGVGCGVEVFYNGLRGIVLFCFGVLFLKKKKRCFVYRLQNFVVVGYICCLVYVNEILILEVLGFCFCCCIFMEVCCFEEFKLFFFYFDEGIREFLGFGIGWLLWQELVCLRVGMF